ncbi:MAG: hypothetical protein HY259_13395 [Chloroflexi bacterium]|nr:hypothetical protein [Chloroflexota bacterium]
MQKWGVALTLVTLMFVAASTHALAWPGGPPVKLVVQGPGLDRSVEVTQREFLDGLGAEQFVNFNWPVSRTPQADTGYRLTRYSDDSTQGFVDHLLYYPNSAGRPGLVRYDGSERGGGEYFTGKWYYTTPRGDAAIRRLLAWLGVSAQVEALAKSLPPPAVALEAMPAPLKAGQPIEIGFKVSQIDSVALPKSPIVSVQQADSASRAVYVAKPDGAAGRYKVTIEVPDGIWLWMVDLGGELGEQIMPALAAGSAAALAGQPDGLVNSRAAVSAGAASGASAVPPVVMLLVGVVIGLAVMLFARRAMTRRPA